MAAKFIYRDGGVWRTAKALHYRDGGVWRNLKAAWYRDGGVWRKVFQSFTALTGVTATSSIAPGSTDPTVELRSTGEIWAYEATTPLVAVASWGSPTTSGAGADFWVRATLGTGTGTITSGTFGSWTNLASTQSWTMAAAPSGQARNRTVSYEIASDSGGSNIVGGGTLYLESDRT